MSSIDHLHVEFEMIKVREDSDLQYTQNEAFRIATGCHTMSSIDHLHVEFEMIKVREDSDLQYTQNEAFRIATGCHKMSSIDHLHVELEMLKVREDSDLVLYAQYLTRCLEPDNISYCITTRDNTPSISY